MDPDLNIDLDPELAKTTRIRRRQRLPNNKNQTPDKEERLSLHQWCPLEFSKREFVNQSMFDRYCVPVLASCHQGGGSGSVESVSFPWIRISIKKMAGSGIRIRIK